MPYSISAIIFMFLLMGATSCTPSIKKHATWTLLIDTVQNEYGYRNEQGDTVIPIGKYPFCFTDTFRHFAIVAPTNGGIIAIDQQENVLYHVFVFDNGPDEPANGLFRIIQDGKIGYADITNGKIVIPPQYDGAYPFEQGIAKVGIGCKRETNGEHYRWTGGQWFEIDRTGKTISQ